MAWLLHRSAPLLVSLSVTALGCFTSPINERPTVSIVPPSPNDIARGVAMQFRAQAHDDQAGPLGYQWGAARVACADGDPIPSVPTTAQGTGETFTITVDMPGDVCVFVTVSDDFGATTSAVHGVRIDDRAPLARIQEVLVGMVQPMLRSTVPLYSALRFTASGSSDPDSADTLDVSWMLTSPDMAARVLAASCDGGSSDVCFSVLVPGTYVLVLSVTDGDGKTTAATATIQVPEDQPPCIDPNATEPDFRVMLTGSPDSELKFKVTGVDDDGDPLPAPDGQTSGATFVWSWRVGTSGPFSRRVSYSSPSFSFPAGSFQLGNTLEVRVEVGDRKDRTAELASCRDADPLVCEVPSGCKRWVTWTTELIR